MFPVKRKASSVCRVSNNLDDTPNFSGRDIFKIIQFLKGNILSLVELKKAQSQILLSPQRDREKNPVILLFIFFHFDDRCLKLT